MRSFSFLSRKNRSCIRKMCSLLYGVLFISLVYESNTTTLKSENQCDRSLEQLQDFADSQGNVPVGTITLQTGVKIGDKVNSLTCGKRGPALLEDTVLIEELSHFDRERIPERVNHAKGGGAHGYFVVTHPEIEEYSKALVFSKVGKKTNVFVRFSQVVRESGSADTVRDTRGFAIKFYTEDGIWDLVGNNTPLFSIRDALLFPSFTRSSMKNPKTHLRDPNSLWDFMSLRPESLHQLSFIFSDRGIPDGWRFMHGFGIKTIPPEEAARLAGINPDYAIKDLYNAIAAGDYPSWTFYVQIMTFEQAEKWYHNPFDVTKVWPHKEFPLIQVGQLVLNRNPDNYFAEVEQVAFNVANMPPGIEPSPDKILQGRLFSYLDAQLYRLGKNHMQIPINSPTNAPIITPTIRDGNMVVNGNMDGAPNYFPNSYLKASTDPRYKTSRYRTSSPDVERFEPGNEDNFSQVRLFWEKVLDEGHRERLVQNLAGSLKNAYVFLQKRMVNLFSKVHADYGNGLLKALSQYNSTTTYQNEKCLYLQRLV